MEKISYIKKFTIKPNANEAQLLADEIYTYFGKQLSFPRIMHIIATKGKIWTRQTFLELKKTDCKDRLALFLWKVKECRVIPISPIA